MACARVGSFDGATHHHKDHRHNWGRPGTLGGLGVEHQHSHEPESNRNDAEIVGHPKAHELVYAKRQFEKWKEKEEKSTSAEGRSRKDMESVLLRVESGLRKRNK